MSCEDCPLQAAYAQYTIERDIQPDDVSYKEIFSGLTAVDAKSLEMMTENSDIGRSYAIDGSNCPGPRKTLFGLGKKACQARLGLAVEDRQII